jgi:integrase
MRIGELLALRWQVVDFGAGTLHIRESVFKDQFQTPKTSSAVRTIPVGPAARQLLSDHRQRSLNVNSDDLLFAWKNGKRYSEPYLLQEILQPAGGAAGIGRVTWHQFRHIHSSNLHQLFVPAKIAQPQLGHASTKTTFNIYTHVVDSEHRKAICAPDRLWFPTVPSFDESRNSGETVN